MPSDSVRAAQNIPLAPATRWRRVVAASSLLTVAFHVTLAVNPIGFVHSSAEQGGVAGAANASQISSPSSVGISTPTTARGNGLYSPPSSLTKAKPQASDVTVLFAEANRELQEKLAKASCDANTAWGLATAAATESARMESALKAAQNENAQLRQQLASAQHHVVAQHQQRTQFEMRLAQAAKERAAADGERNAAATEAERGRDWKRPGLEVVGIM